MNEFVGMDWGFFFSTLFGLIIVALPVMIAVFIVGLIVWIAKMYGGINPYWNRRQP